jgi:hypothetical protein
VHQIGNQPRFDYDARSTSHQEEYLFNKTLKISAVTYIISYRCKHYWTQYYNVHTIIPKVYKRELAAQCYTYPAILATQS